MNARPMRKAIVDDGSGGCMLYLGLIVGVLDDALSLASMAFGVQYMDDGWV